MKKIRYIVYSHEKFSSTYGCQRYVNVKHNKNIDVKIRIIGVNIHQLQYFLMEIDVDTQQWHGLELLFPIISITEENPYFPY